jgi:fatty acid desaturase
MIVRFSIGDKIQQDLQFTTKAVKSCAFFHCKIKEISSRSRDFSHARCFAMTAIGRIEWPTVALIAAVYSIWFTLCAYGHYLNPVLWVVIAGTVTALYWSIVHEVIHGHPTRNALVNHALVWLPIGWVYAHGRFRDGHLHHHETGELTDPFDDPESWYMAQHDWKVAGPMSRALLTFNNTLLGRLTVGPFIVLWRMVRDDAVAIARGGQRGWAVARAWLWHVPPVIVLALIVGAITDVKFWQFVVAAFIGVSLILIRTFLEHQAAEDFGERTVIIEDSGPLAFLFLFNNLHVVHHTRPGLAWYLLPGFYKAHREQFIKRNNGYVYPGYRDVFKKHFLKAKEPVPHPYVV